jgi:hypothetical protein
MLEGRIQKDKVGGNPNLEIGPHAVKASSSHEAQFFDARMGWGELFDRHIEKGLILCRLFFADAHTPLVELFISFEKKDDLGIIGDFVSKLRVFPEIPIKLHS